MSKTTTSKAAKKVIAAAQAKAKARTRIVQKPGAGVADMYANPRSNTGWGSTSQVNFGEYVPYRISLDYLQLLYAYRGSWIIRAVVDTIPEDMLKTWPKLLCDITPQERQAFERVVQETMSLQKMIENLKWGRLFGGSLAIIILSGEHQKDLSQPLVLEDVDLDSYRGLIVVDRWSGCNPSSDLVSNIDNPAEYGLPVHYEVTTEVNQNFKVHHSRVIRATGRDLPLFEKQIQTYWGMSEVEAGWQELQRTDAIKAGIADLVARANVLVVQEPMLAQMLSGVGLTQQQLQDYLLRMSAVSESITTNGVMALSEGSELFAHSYTFAGLRDIHDASMENVSGAFGMPMCKLGRPNSGLGNTGEGELQIYEDSLTQKREHQVRPGFEKLMKIIAQSTWGRVPDDFDFRFAPIRTPTAKERAELGKSQIDPVVSLYDKGLRSAKKTLMELQRLSDENGLNVTISQEEIDAAPDDLIPSDVAFGVPQPGDEGDDGADKPKPKPGAKDSALSLFLAKLGMGGRGDGGM